MQFLVVSIFKHELCGQNFETDAQMIHETQTIVEQILKEEFKTMVQK